MRTFIAILAAAFISLAFAATEASARPGGGGFRGGGFHGGGFRGFHGGFRGRGFPFVGAAVGLGLGAGYWGYPGYYGYGDGCLQPRRIWTPYGWRVRLVNLCYY
ncbi:MAG: hypothetical protein QOF14_467 [Hyphomicrobiales bacterium]|jgi:hypothetical protein|nr:hypothetical protein [Hyphomicrobiales bacterium]